ncbi:iron-containing alcohol dehydrogenase [Methanoregula sp.]|uniref:iron-containing alcohol dehydrogenase n=1 Tax=Methanoregula sp. TaxID=2052170 RepID=UPI003C721A6D
MDFDFNLKTNAKFGTNKALNLAQYLKELSLSRPGIIIDGGIAGLEHTRKVLSALESDPDITIRTWVYDLRHEPDYDSLDRIKAMFLDNSGKPVTDCFVGIGGGSVIDFAKGLSTVVVNPGKAVLYKGFPVKINPSLPTIAIPTTAGTGSEVTFNAVFTDNNQKKKLGINTRNNYPALAILDPVFTVNSPMSVTVSSGMDALVHTLESYSAVQSNPLNRIFAREAFSMIFNNLFLVKDHPGNGEIRAKIQYGAYLAGISLINSGSGPSGALSYPLGVHFKVPHGMAGAVFIPHIVRHNVQAGYDYSELYDLIDGSCRSLSMNAKNEQFVEKMFALCKKLDVPPNLSGFGVNAGTVDILLADIDALERAFTQNPVPFTVDDGKKLILNMI